MALKAICNNKTAVLYFLTSYFTDSSSITKSNLCMSDFLTKFKKKKHTQRRVRTQALNPGHTGSRGALKAGERVFSIEEPPVGYPIPNGHPREKNTNIVM